VLSPGREARSTQPMPAVQGYIVRPNSSTARMKLRWGCWEKSSPRLVWRLRVVHGEELGVLKTIAVLYLGLIFRVGVFPPSREAKRSHDTQPNTNNKILLLTAPPNLSCDGTARRKNPQLAWRLRLSREENSIRSVSCKQLLYCPYVLVCRDQSLVSVPRSSKRNMAHNHASQHPAAPAEHGVRWDR
jgi:hypothetical protein